MLLTFTKPEFENLIKDGIKKHTIRADKNNRWQVGNSIQFWLGSPRNVHAKNKPRQFGYGECTRVEKVKMLFHEKNDLNLYDIVLVGATELSSWEELTALAKNDGFNSWEEMKQWFDNPTREFKGRMIFWNYAKCVWL